MMPADVRPSMHIDLTKENSMESPKFKVDNHIRISNYKNIFAKIYAPNWSEGGFVIKKG